jgi:hypothetical protein
MRSARALAALASLALAACAFAGDGPAELYRHANGKVRDVAIRELAEVEVRPGVRARPLRYVSSMTIDADGAGDAWRGDPTGQPETSLRYADERSLDPTATAYIVLPLGFEARHAGVRLGDVAAVRYEGKTAFAIWGDEGPDDQVGEGSIALARALGIDPDPVRGGTDDGVEYTVFPRSGDGAPLERAEVERRGKALLAAVRER